MNRNKLQTLLVKGVFAMALIGLIVCLYIPASIAADEVSPVTPTYQSNVSGPSGDIIAMNNWVERRSKSSKGWQNRSVQTDRPSKPSGESILAKTWVERRIASSKAWPNPNVSKDRPAASVESSIFMKSWKERRNASSKPLH